MVAEVLEELTDLSDFGEGISFLRLFFRLTGVGTSHSSSSCIKFKPLCLSALFSDDLDVSPDKRISLSGVSDSFGDRW